MPKPKRIPSSIKKALSGAGVTIPQVAELVGNFMQIAGGPRALAKMMFKEFMSAKEGSLVRQRILDGIMKMLSLANQQYLAVEETDMISQSDLEAELQGLIQGLPDGEEAEPEDPAGVDPVVPAAGAEPAGPGAGPGPVVPVRGDGADADPGHAGPADAGVG